MNYLNRDFTITKDIIVGSIQIVEVVPVDSELEPKLVFDRFRQANLKLNPTTFFNVKFHF